VSTSPRAGGVDSLPAAVLDLVGLAAYVELAEFGLLAARSVDAPDLATRQALADGADRALARQGALVALVSAEGATPDATAGLMAPFDGALAEFDTRTRSTDWAEGVLTGIVGHGVLQDLCRALATGVPGSLGKDLGEVLGRPGPVTGRAARTRVGADAGTIAVVTRLAGADDVLASRLALWGRRVVGEALRTGTSLLDSRPSLGTLAGDAARESGTDPGAARSWLVTRLTGEHTRRMDRLRLAA
jgi:hypothetical protein